MNWQEAEQIMIDRGYKRQGLLRRISGVIDKLVFIKQTERVILQAQLFTDNESCDTCWKVKLLFTDLPFFMTLESGSFQITTTMFEAFEGSIIYSANKLKS